MAVIYLGKISTTLLKTSLGVQSSPGALFLPIHYHVLYFLHGILLIVVRVHVFLCYFKGVFLLFRVVLLVIFWCENL